MRQSGYLRLSQTDMYYEVYGEGPPLLLLHGWTQTSGYWKSLVPEFSKNYTTYVMDLRGHGKSGMLDDSFTIQAAAKDVMEMMDTLGLDTVRAVGLSFGGIILLENAHRSPERFKALVLVGTVFDYNGRDIDAGDFSWKDLPADFRANLLEVHTKGEPQVEKLFNPDLNYQVHLSAGDLKKMNMPVLVVSGDEDTIAGPEAALQLFQLLPRASLWIIPGYGHVPVDERNRREFAGAVNTFLQK